MFDEVMDRIEYMETEEWTKVIGGAVAGIGAIAALPIFGAVGTVTALGAVLGGAAGAGAGYLLAESENQEHTAERRKLESDCARFHKETALIRTGLADSAGSMESYNNALKCAYAVAAYAFHRDYPDAVQRENEAKLCMDTILAAWASKEFKVELDKLFLTPPTHHDLRQMLTNCMERKDLDEKAFSKAVQRISEILEWKGVIGQEFDLKEFIGVIDEKNSTAEPEN